MKTRTTIFTGSSTLEVHEVELPKISPRQVLIKVKACALCTWEQRFYKGCSPEDYPFRGGHEISGEVVEIGAEAQCDAKVGDPVAAAILTRCGSCYYCRRGMDNLCEQSNVRAQPGELWGPGGLSDYVLIDDYQVYKASLKCDFSELALSEPVACVVRSVTKPGLLFGDTAMVQGAGIMGLLHIKLLKLRGVRVLMCEPDENRRQIALNIGADTVADPLVDGFTEIACDFTAGRGFNSVFFTAGGIPAIEQALPLLSKGGWLCLYGSVHPKGHVQVDPNDIHYNELVITGTITHTKHSFQQAVTLLSNGLVDVSPFISEKVPFPDVDYGFKRAISPDTYRVVMTFNE